MRFFSDTDWYDNCQAEQKVAYYDSCSDHEGSGVLYVGHAQIQAGDSMGPVMRDHYIYHLVLSGNGIYRINGLEFRVSASESFLVFPGQMVSYEPDAKDPWAYYYVAFVGETFSQIVEKAGLTPEDPIVHHEDSSQCRKLINTLIENMQINDEISEMAIPAILQLLLCTLANDKLAQANRLMHHPSSATDQYVSYALHMIQNNYNKPLSVVSIAASLGIDPSYFSRIFKKSCGTSPAVYIQQYRLLVAQTLLVRSSMPVKDIAYRVGFNDPSYFTRCFTQQYGVTPKDARLMPLVPELNI